MQTANAMPPAAPQLQIALGNELACEAALRLRDVPAALEVCSALHQRYADFGGELVATLAKACTAAPAAGADEQGQFVHLCVWKSALNAGSLTLPLPPHALAGALLFPTACRR